MIVLYEYPKCSTCRKARNWLDAQGISYRRSHLVDDTPSAEKLGELVTKSQLPIKKFFNTSGGSYREGNFKERLPEMSRDEALEALAADGMLIKRPVLETDDAVLVGFREAEYQRTLG